MKKTHRKIAWVLVAAVLLWMVPALPAEASPGGQTLGMKGKDDGGKAAEAAKNQVVVLYEDGEVPAQEPSGAKKARSANGESAQNAQEKIIGNALDGGDFTIDDTIVIESADEAAESMVVGVVSSDDYSSEKLAEKLEEAEGIRYAEPNYIYRISSMPDWNDPYLKDSWQLGDKGLNVSKAPAAAGSGEPVVMAVLDTGVDYSHPDLKEHIWTAPEGFVLKGEHGVDWSDKDDDPMDENGHGTHCAGIIAASADNGKGAAGIAGDRANVQLMGVRVLDAEGSGYLEDIVKGYKYIIRAKKAGVNIKAINCSFGAGVTSDIFDEVIDQAGQAGILTIAAAGNESNDNDKDVVSPANSKSDYVVVVAAMDRDGSFASYSNYGKRNVDVGAPGSNILAPVSYYNFAPYLYDANTVKDTTYVYGEFDGAEMGIDAESGMSFVTPVTGTAYDGEAITGVESFGYAIQRFDLPTNSHVTTTLEITDGTEEDAFPVGNNQKCLRWHIENAEEGDKCIMYFPYDKIGGKIGSDAYVNIVFRTHTGTGNEDGEGLLYVGDVLVYNAQKPESLNDANWETSAEEAANIYAVEPDMNSIWRASADYDLLYEKGKFSEQHKDNYGLGFVYEAQIGGDVDIYISSIAIAANGVKEEKFGMYDVYSGTSMATPAVTGAAGLIAAADPEIDAETLKATILGSTTSAGSLSGKCSTGGRVDFESYSSSPSEARPSVSSVTADFAAETVTIKGRGFGDAPQLKAYRNTVPEGESGEIAIDAADISATGDTITISNAGFTGHGLIGSDIRFEITNGDKKGEVSSYIVKGLDPYDDEYSTACEEQDFFIWDKSSGEDVPDDPVMPTGLSFVNGANDLYKYNSAGDIYRLVLNEENGKYYPEQRGITAGEAVNEYGKEKAKTVELWVNDDDEKNPVYNYQLAGAPVCSGGVIYELVNVDMVDRDAYLLMGLDLYNEEDTWRVYYDSLSDFGSKPEELDFRKLENVTLAAYGGRIYMLGGNCKENYDEATEEYTAEISKDYFSCLPDIRGSEWNYEGELPEARTNGKALVSNGKMYYFFTNDAEGMIDYGIYAYDGAEWTKAGELPKALFADSEDAVISFIGDMILISFDDSERLLCATGVDSKGILFAGKSFDGPGDTFRFNTSTNTVEPLKYTLWGTVSDRRVDGTPMGGKFVAEYMKDSTNEAIGKSFPIESAFVNLEKNIGGEGSGVVTGGGSYVKGDASTVTITPDKGSYIYSVSSSGLSPELNKEYGKATDESKGTLTATYNAAKDGTLDVEFGFISTKVIVPKKTVNKAVGKRTVDGYTDGTISDVKWTSSNTKYAKPNSDGTITFTKAGLGKTVTLTATSVEVPALKASCKVKIVSREQTKFKWSKKNFTTKSKVMIDQPLAKAKTPKSFKVKKSGGKAVLSWKKVKGVSGYIVLRRTGKGRFVQIAKVAAGRKSYTDKTVKKGKKYQYVMVGYTKVKGSRALRISPATAAKKFKR